jgi:hypothetical protein
MKRENKKYVRNCEVGMSERRYRRRKKDNVETGRGGCWLESSGSGRDQLPALVDAAITLLVPQSAESLLPAECL